MIHRSFCNSMLLLNNELYIINYIGFHTGRPLDFIFARSAKKKLHVVIFLKLLLFNVKLCKDT